MKEKTLSRRQKLILSSDLSYKKCSISSERKMMEVRNSYLHEQRIKVE